MAAPPNDGGPDGSSIVSIQPELAAPVSQHKRELTCRTEARFLPAVAFREHGPPAAATTTTPNYKPKRISRSTCRQTPRIRFLPCQRAASNTQVEAWSRASGHQGKWAGPFACPQRIPSTTTHAARCPSPRSYCRTSAVASQRQISQPRRERRAKPVEPR